MKLICIIIIGLLSGCAVYPAPMGYSSPMGYSVGYSYPVYGYRPHQYYNGYYGGGYYYHHH